MTSFKQTFTVKAILNFDGNQHIIPLGEFPSIASFREKIAKMRVQLELK